MKLFAYIFTSLSVLILLGCSDKSKFAKSEDSEQGSTTLRNLVYVDMFSPNYPNQHPLVCKNGGDFPQGSELAFKNTESNKMIHAVFSKEIPSPKRFDNDFTLHGYYQCIQNKNQFNEMKTPKRGYQYFVVSSWESKNVEQE